MAYARVIKMEFQPNNKNIYFNCFHDQFDAINE